VHITLILAGLLFFNRALVVPVFKDAGGPGGFRFLHDPVSGMVTAQFVHSNYGTTFSFGCFASLHQAWDAWALVPDVHDWESNCAEAFAAKGFDSTAQRLCSHFEVTIADVCYLGARCITKGDSVEFLKNSKTPTNPSPGQNFVSIEFLEGGKKL
jgi:hypothetical protein